MTHPSPRNPGVARRFFSGVAYLGRGAKLWGTAPALMWIGVIPAFIVAIFFVVAFVLLAMNLDGLASWVTPFAASWDEPFRTGIRFVAGFAFIAVAVLIAVYTFTALTLIVGNPFYERIWRHVESRDGEVPVAQELGFWRALRRGLGDALRLLVPTVLVGASVFALGFLPLVGGMIAATLGALFGGWFLALELTALAFDTRGLTLRERRRILGSQRLRTLGFGVAAYLAFLVPGGAVLLMPAAVAGATLLSRTALAEAGIVLTQTEPAHANGVPPEGDTPR